MKNRFISVPSWCARRAFYVGPCRKSTGKEGRFGLFLHEDIGQNAENMHEIFFSEFVKNRIYFSAKSEVFALEWRAIVG
jgi:hypothetical protein